MDYGISVPRRYSDTLHTEISTERGRGMLDHTEWRLCESRRAFRPNLAYGELDDQYRSKTAENRTVKEKDKVR